MKNSIFANLPNHLIIKILVERKEIKKIENYKKNYDIFVKSFKDTVQYMKCDLMSDRGIFTKLNKTKEELIELIEKHFDDYCPLIDCLEPTFEVALQDYNPVAYYNLVSDHFDDEDFDNIILDYYTEYEDLEPSQDRNSLNLYID